LISKTIQPHRKRPLDGAFIHDGIYIPRDLDADYSGGESFLISQLSATGQRNWPKAQTWGLTAEAVSPSQMERISDYLERWESVSFKDRRLVADGLISYHQG